MLHNYKKTTLEDVQNLIEKYMRDEYPGWKKMHVGEYDSISDQLHKTLISYVLSRCGGSIVKAAEQIGMNRNTLRKFMIKMDMYENNKKRDPYSYEPCHQTNASTSSHC